MSKLTKRQADDLQAFHDDQMKKMQGPTTVEIISFLREEAITMTLAECDTTYMVIAAANRLEEAEANRDDIIKNLERSYVREAAAEAQLEKIRELIKEQREATKDANFLSASATIVLNCFCNSLDKALEN